MTEEDDYADAFLLQGNKSSLFYTIESQASLVSSLLYTFGLTGVSAELLFMWVITISVYHVENVNLKSH